MKRFTKFVGVLLVLSMMLSIVPAAFAAEYNGEQGKTVNVVFEFEKILGINGDTFEIDDPKGIVASSKIVKIETGLNGTFNDERFIYSCFADETSDFKLVYEIELKEDATVGATCTVTMVYDVTEGDMTFKTEQKIDATIVVKAKGDVPPTEPDDDDPSTTPTTPTDPDKPVDPKPTEPQGSDPSVKIDYTKLQEQINIALGLVKGQYTKESWQALEAALQNAQAALSSRDQGVVDAATQTLKNAIAALVKVDYSALEAAIAAIEKFLENSPLGSKMRDLLDALRAAKELLNSGDQAAVDQAAELLAQLLEELEKEIQNMTKIEEIIKEIEKIVEVEPTDPYCNISIHHVWPILFFISLALNVGFIALIVVYVIRRKKNQTDDTPLVNYDIGEDAAE